MLQSIPGRGCLLVFLYSTGISHPVFLEVFRKEYGYSISCAACHDYSMGLNSFGGDFKKNGFSFRAIENTDSDKDGYKNIDEFVKKSNPGNKKSTPVEPGKFEDFNYISYYRRFIKNRLGVNNFTVNENNGVYYFKGDKSGFVSDIFISSGFIFLGFYAVIDGRIYVEPQFTKGINFKRKFFNSVEEIGVKEIMYYINAKTHKDK